MGRSEVVSAQHAAGLVPQNGMHVLSAVGGIGEQEVALG